MSSSSSVPTITFIGGGNMCEAILSGLLKTSHPQSHIRVSEPFDQRREYLNSKYGVDVFGDNKAAITGEGAKVSAGSPVDVVVLAVKPQVVGTVVRDVAPALLKHKPLVISIVAGVAIKDFARWIHPDGAAGPSDAVPFVRLMPNTPALVGEGAAGMYAEDTVNKEQRAQTEYVVKNIAKEYFWVDKESGIDAVTAISGSGPAYFFLILEAMEKTGVEMGLDRTVAGKLAAQTALGAARMLLTGDDDVETLRRKVTSPNGTTHAAIERMIADKVPEGVSNGVLACRARCVSLADEFGKL
ncbi:hypothetical protein EV179_004363 [Coemansia sp. RSA 487]|nr:hypothetical protein LPJ74_005194 [Coemansia sp. RSA 1843]KAJ2087074.1 hypothetical protein IW138_005231 [Coemansia sp. RSA 986]KAJ2212796.1 hypothetical protein EV179_004363 [Coemansia sp. RSA 487]